MRAVLLDFNGTMFFDTSLHMEAWSKIYQELYPEDVTPLDTARVVGANNDVVLQNLASWLTPEARAAYSIRKEELYRQVCKEKPEMLHLAPGVEAFLQYLVENRIPFALASASILDNIDFYFETFDLDRWFQKDQVVYDDGTWPNKGAMHLEAARRMGVEIGDCLLIEDSGSSIIHAKHNGAGCIVAIGDSEDPDVLMRLGADHYIRDFTELDLAWLC